MGSKACKHCVIRDQIVHTWTYIILSSNSKCEQYLAGVGGWRAGKQKSIYHSHHKGSEELGTECFQDKNQFLNLMIRIFSMAWTSHTFTLSNLWFDGHVLITYRIVQILCAQSMHQRGTTRSNYVQTKLLNGQWKWGFQLFLTTCLPIFWCLVFFGLICSSLMASGKNLQKTDGEDQGCLGTWAIFFTQECD